MQQWDVETASRGGDEAVDHPSHGTTIASAGAVDHRGITEIARHGFDQGGASEKTPQLQQLHFVTRTGEDLQLDSTRDRQRIIVGKQSGEVFARRTPLTEALQRAEVELGQREHDLLVFGTRHRGARERSVPTTGQPPCAVVTFEPVVIHAVGVGSSAIGHVLAELLHVHAGPGHASGHVDLDHGIEDHELEELELGERLADEPADGVGTIETHLLIAEVQFKGTCGPHDLVQLSPGPAGHDVGVPVLGATDVEIVECLGEAFLG